MAGTEAEVPVWPAPAKVSRKSAGPSGPKSVGVAYLWSFFLGLFGAHHFYLGRTRLGLVHLCTVGLCGLGWLADAATLPCQVRSANARTTPSDVVPRAEATVGPHVYDSVC